jgi:carbon storage regulator CsrA
VLVLSRRENEKVVFANLGVSVEVLRLAGKVVRLGIQAPAEIQILREELAAPPAADGPSARVAPGLPLVKSVGHMIRNRLNIASLGLQVLQRRLETGDADAAEATIAKIFNELSEIDAMLDSSQPPEPAQQGESSRPPLRQRRALIVEDNPNESELLATCLQMSGYAVEVVADGFEALSYLDSHEHPDFVLLDMAMPRCNGPQTVASIRRNPALRNLRLFAVSGADQRETGVAFGRLGVDRWFSKPVNARELIREMERNLQAAVNPPGA